MHTHTCKVQRLIYQSVIFLSITWGPGIQLNSSELAAKRHHLQSHLGEHSKVTALPVLTSTISHW